MSKKVNTSQLKALQKDYRATLTPTADEVGTSTGLDNILASRDLGIVKVNDQPIASDFVQGQSAGLMRQASAQAQPLEQKLARLQATRASAADVLKAKLGFESDNVNRQLAVKASEDAKKAAKKAAEEEQRRYNTSLQLKQSGLNAAAGQQNSDNDLKLGYQWLQQRLKGQNTPTEQQNLPQSAIPNVNFSLNTLFPRLNSFLTKR